MRIAPSILVSVAAVVAALGPGAPAALAAPAGAGDWSVRTGRTLQAVTTAGTGDRFGQWCDAADGNCHYALLLPVPCEPEERYVALANSDTSVSVAELVCGGETGARASARRLYRYVFANFGAIDHQVRQSRRIGFALPLDGDAFRFARFSLAGAMRAIGEMRGAAQRTPAPKERDRAATAR